MWVQLHALVCVRVTDCKANEKSKPGRLCAVVNGCMEVLTCVTAPIGSAGVVLGEIRGSGTKSYVSVLHVHNFTCFK